MQLQSKPTRVTCWAKSTESKVTTFLDDYLIHYPVKSVRQSTRNLLNSLFKKGTATQKQNMLNLIRERINKLSTMGNSSSEFLNLIFSIFQGQVQNKENEKKQILSTILEKGQQILKKAASSQNYEFYCYLSNTIEFSVPLQPYLIEASGCLKCYGKTEFAFEQKDYKDVMIELKAHISQIEVIFNKIYAVKDLKINLGKKKIIYKSVSIFYIDQKGEKKQLGGKYSPQQSLPNLEFNGSALIFEFQLQKSKRHITCHVCGNGNSPDEYCYICSVCFQKCVEIDGSFKAIGADPERLSTELCSKYLYLGCKKQELEYVYEDVKNGRKAQFPNYSMIKEMEDVYGQIMKNLQLLKRDQSKNFSLQECKYCFACNIIEIQNIVDFFKLNFQFSEENVESFTRSFTTEEISSLIRQFIEISSVNKLLHLERKVVSIIANLILLKSPTSLDFNQELIGITSPKIACDILYEMMRSVKRRENKLKQNESLNFDWNGLGSFLNSTNFRQQWSIEDRVKLFSAYFIKSQLIDVVSVETDEIEKQSLNDLSRLEIKEFMRFEELISFRVDDVLKLRATTHMKIFLMMLPESLVPEYSVDITDATYLKYIKPTVPQITDQMIQSNIVFSPYPIIKLNLFPTLPDLISYLSLQDSMKLIASLSKYRQLWNMNIKETIKEFEEKLTEETAEKKLLLSLQGYDISKEEMYLNKIYQIIVPQRMKFIIRLEIPEADMQREERARGGGPVEYVYLPVREVKSEELNGDTMRALHEWVTAQLKKMDRVMPFDLIVDKYIIDNLELPIEVVYKKIAQKEMKKKIGLQQYDFMKVIYRIQGIFGNPTESVSSNPRDENLESCLTYSSHLITKIPAINNKTGLGVIMQLLSKLRGCESSSYRQKVFRIFQIISMNPAIIKKIINEQYADFIINFTSKFFSLQESEIKFSEVMLDICEKIIKEANEQMINLRKKSVGDGFGGRKESDIMELQNVAEEGVSESEKAVKYLLEKVKQCDEKDRKDLAQKIITLIPFSSKDEYSTSKYLFEYFELTNATISDLRSNKRLNWFLQFIDTLSESYTSFKIFCRQNKFTDNAITNISQSLESFNTLEEKKTIKNLETLELSLSIIKGLIRGDEILQKNLYDQNIIQQLLKISKMSQGELQKKNIKVGKVLTLSYEIVNYCREGRIVHPEVADFVKGEYADKLKRNQDRKKAKLEANRKKNQLIAQKYQSELMINEQQDTLVCGSCRQGLTKKNDVMGVYIYSFKIETSAVEGWWKQNKRQPGLTSVSYFTPIHYQCHMSAIETDKEMNKSEWQGALIRNSDVKCNGWIGIKGPKTSDDEYDKANKKYFDKNTKITGYWVVLNDMNGLLEKFATEYNFSQETKGSSSTHNCKLMLVLLASTCHYMKKCPDEQFIDLNHRLKQLQQGTKYIQEHMTKRGHLLYLFFCIGLFTNTYGMYQQKKEKYLKLIDHLELTDFKEKKKFFIYLALINEIYCLIHVTMKQEQKIYEYLDRFIPENFASLIAAFEKIADKYKTIFIKWDNEAQVKEYFALST